MEVLERYLSDCEAKRRRMRDRPSNQVLEELRSLLSRFKRSRTPEESPPHSESDPAEPAPPSP